MNNQQNNPELNEALLGLLTPPIPGISTYFRHKNEFCLENCWYCDNPEVSVNKRFIPSRHYTEMIKNNKETNNE